MDQSYHQRYFICYRKVFYRLQLYRFKDLLKEHESILSKILGIEPIQQRLFPDYNGQIKSLGAWGGDFILATGDNTTADYFRLKGYQTVIPYSSMIKIV